MNIPNIITFFRIVMVPFFVILLIYGYTFYAFLTFILAGVTDALDGLIARVFNQKTVLGAYLDPIADKFLITTSYIVLAVLGTIQPWLAVLVISRDIVILMGIAVLFVNHKHLEIKPTILGKVSTFTQITTVFITLSAAQSLASLMAFLPATVYLTAFFTVISGFHYAYMGVWQMGEDDKTSKNA